MLVLCLCDNGEFWYCIPLIYVLHVRVRDLITNAPSVYRKALNGLVNDVNFCFRRKRISRINNQFKVTRSILNVFGLIRWQIEFALQIYLFLIVIYI